MTSETCDLRNVLERLERVEQQNRHLKYAGFCLLAVGAMAVLVGLRAPAKNTVEAEQFIVKDATGKMRAKFGATGLGTTGLNLLDDDGNTVIDLSVRPDRVASLTVQDRMAPGALKLGTSQGVPYVQLDARGSTRLFFSAVPDPLLKLMSPEGKQRAALWVEANGLPALRFYGSDEKERLMIGMRNTFESFIDTGVFLSDETGQSRASLNLSGGLYPGLSLIDKDLGASVLINVAQGSATLRLADKDRKVIWSAP